MATTGREFHEPPADAPVPTGPPPKPSDSRQSVRTDIGRIADALEKLTSDDNTQLELGPPVCPHCHRINPEITIPAQDEQTGPMLELVVEATCVACKGRMYVTIESFMCHTNIEAAAHDITQRKAGFQGD